MKQEDKQLLLKDISARLPYDVIINREGEQEFLIGIEYGESFITKDTVDKTPQFTTEKFGGQRFVCDIDDIKPYLRPLSSMTSTEESRYIELCDRYCNMVSSDILVTFLTSNHFDYNGLIEKGLAIEAPEEMYNGN